MRLDHIITELARNKNNFKYLLSHIEPDQYRWKPNDKQWCLLEVLCHLRDEETEDFKTRIKMTLENPDQEPPPIRPDEWAKERKYLEQDYEETLNEFITERNKSLEWLETLQDAPWRNAYQHKRFGPLSASMFAANWVAHDYIHIRQILRLKHQYLGDSTKEVLLYAGEW